MITCITDTYCLKCFQTLTKIETCIFRNWIQKYQYFTHFAYFLKPNTRVPLFHLQLLPTAQGEPCNILTVISKTVALADLWHSRATESLHINIGSTDTTLAPSVRKALTQVKRWELVIAKCQAGTIPQKVTEFCERKELEW